jgi:hypothetical protein
MPARGLKSFCTSISEPSSPMMAQACTIASMCTHSRKRPGNAAQMIARSTAFAQEPRCPPAPGTFYTLHKAISFISFAFSPVCLHSPTLKA